VSETVSRSRALRRLPLPVVGIVVIGLAASGCGGEARVAGKAGADAARSYKAPGAALGGGTASAGGGCAASSRC
jgi:hypothetical protein